MTGGLSYQLWRLSEAGEPVVMLGRQHGAEEEAAFERLLQLGIVVHRGREASWAVCHDCDCGADERAIVWDGDAATAKCAVDRQRDERLDGEPGWPSSGMAESSSEKKAPLTRAAPDARPRRYMPPRAATRGSCPLSQREICRRCFAPWRESWRRTWAIPSSRQAGPIVSSCQRMRGCGRSHHKKPEYPVFGFNRR